jgi:hypothetical protein
VSHFRYADHLAALRRVRDRVVAGGMVLPENHPHLRAETDPVRLSGRWRSSFITFSPGSNHGVGLDWDDRAGLIVRAWGSGRNLETRLALAAPADFVEDALLLAAGYVGLLPAARYRLAVREALADLTWPQVSGPDYDPYPGTLDEVADEVAHWVGTLDPRLIQKLRERLS